MTTTPTRLPCRGCMKTCKNYLICQGKPWRLPQEELTSQHVDLDELKILDIKNKIFQGNIFN